ncbi:MAG TPA: Uma2 family endonuclease [Polyangiaceae bacterium]
MTLPFSARTRVERRYVRPPEPLHFPESEEMPETGLHLVLCTHLFLLVQDFVGERGAVGSDQFVYWDPLDPRKSLAPDLIVRMGAPSGVFPSWKTWERGAPHVGVEIVSDFDAARGTWSDKLARYRGAGIDEVVRFDPSDREHPLRLWDRFEGDLVERVLEGENALLSDALGAYWCVREDPKIGPMLGLALDPFGERLVPSPEERERAEKEAALARVAELEAELRRRG